MTKHLTPSELKLTAKPLRSEYFFCVLKGWIFINFDGD
jgi:hypothetical protein